VLVRRQIEDQRAIGILHNEAQLRQAVIDKIARLGSSLDDETPCVVVADPAVRDR
jgi:hypothetical protein